MPLSDQDIAAFRTEFRARFPDADDVFVSFGLAQEVIINIMGVANGGGTTLRLNLPPRQRSITFKAREKTKKADTFTNIAWWN